MSTHDTNVIDADPGVGRETAAQVNAALEDGDFDTAYEHLIELLRRNPESSQTCTTAGLVALQLDRQGEATMHFARALKLSPDDYVTNYNMALTEMRQQRFGQALERFRHLRRLDGSNADVLNDIGVVWLQRSNPARALASFSRAMKLDPENSMARNNAMELCLNNDLTGRAETMLAAQESRVSLSLKAKTEIHRWREILQAGGGPESSEPDLQG